MYYRDFKRSGAGTSSSSSSAASLSSSGRASLGGLPSRHLERLGIATDSKLTSSTFERKVPIKKPAFTNEKATDLLKRQLQLQSEANNSANDLPITSRLRLTDLRLEEVTPVEELLRRPPSRLCTARRLRASTEALPAFHLFDENSEASHAEVALPTEDPVPITTLRKRPSTSTGPRPAPSQPQRRPQSAIIRSSLSPDFLNLFAIYMRL